MKQWAQGNAKWVHNRWVLLLTLNLLLSAGLTIYTTSSLNLYYSCWHAPWALPPPSPSILTSASASISTRAAIFMAWVISNTTRITWLRDQWHQEGCVTGEKSVMAGTSVCWGLTVVVQQSRAPCNGCCGVQVTGREGAVAGGASIIAGTSICWGLTVVVQDAL